MHALPPGTCAPYAWDEISKPHYVIFKVENSIFRRRFNLDKIKKYSVQFKIQVEIFPGM